MKLKPRKGEGKQAFFKRAVNELMENGKSKQTAIAEASSVWNQHNLSEGGSGWHYLTAPVQFDLSQKDEELEQRTFDILAYTGGVVDLGYYKFIIAVKGIANKAAFPCLYEHSRTAIAGTATKVSKKNNELFCHGKFHDTEHAREIIKLADDDFPWQASMGIWAKEVRYLARDEKAKINGQDVIGPLYIWETSEMKEISICSLGQDGETAAITMSCPTTDMEFSMYSEELKLALGLAADASDAEVEGALAKLKLNLDADAAESAIWAALHSGGHLSGGKKDTPPDEPVPAANLGGSNPAPAGTDVADQVAQQLKVERERTTGIQNICQQLNLSSEFSETHILAGTGMDSFRKLALDEAAKNGPSFGPSSLSDGEQESDKVRKLAAEGISFKLGIITEKDLSDGALQFAGIPIARLAAMQLQRAGVNTAYMSNREVADMILKPAMRLNASTADFKAVFADVANKQLLKAYNESPVTFEPFVNITSASDFKQMHGVALSDAPDLDLVGENGEYQVGTLKDRQESFSVGKYGKMMRLSLEMIVNDDTRAFTRIPQLFGAAARRKQGDIIYGLLTANKAMADGKKLFCLDHKNVPSASMTLSSEGLSKARAIMRKQTGMQGAVLDVTPHVLLVPVALELNAEVLLRSMADPSGKNAGVANVWKDRLIPVADPRLDADSETDWYLIGNKNQFDTIDLAFLDGKREPEVLEDDDFKTDGINYKCRIIMGAGVMDHVAMFKNTGSAPQK